MVESHRSSSMPIQQPIHSRVKHIPIRYYSCNQVHKLHCSWLLKMILWRQKKSKHWKWWNWTCHVLQMARGNPLQFNFWILTSPRIIKWRRQRPNISSNLGYTHIYVLCCWKIWKTFHVSFRRNNNFTGQEAVRRLRNLLLKTEEKSSYLIHRVSICGSLQRCWFAWSFLQIYGEF